jgi:hypothetical protein
LTKGKKGAEYTSYLLRRTYREGGRVKHENLGNLSHLRSEVIEAVRKMLSGRVLVDLDERFEIESSLPHGHVAAVLGVLRQLDLERLISRERSRQRDLAVAMVCQLVIAPASKLSMTRRFAQTTLGAQLSLGEVTEAELLGAMDWLVDRQDRIENALARLCRTAGSWCMTCPRPTWRDAAASWRRWGITGTASAASCRSTGGSCARPRAGR